MWVLFTVTGCSLIVLVAATMLCLCWKRKTEKNDLLGLDGLVTQKNPDENVNHLSSSAIVHSVPDGILKVTTDTIPPATAAATVITVATVANDANKRQVTVNNPRRSLPDIPSDGGIHIDADTITYEPNGDNSSDLYATVVEPYRNSFTKRHTLPNGLDSQPAISQHSSMSQADDAFSPYARVKEHPYDRVRSKTEHPYARVHPSSSQEQEETSSRDGTPITMTLTRNETLQTDSSRSRRSSTQSGPGSDIPAATAVAGGIAANQELPYMTPPIVQPNFSGDSQDSSKGYTSISVREPLANIRAQTEKLLGKSGRAGDDVDPHYSTVSDDSDDMYTTIQDPNNPIYTSGSETYAQIQPPPAHLTVAAEINLDAVQSSPNETNNHPHDSTPPQPNVDCLKQQSSRTHSRQASSSSSVGNLGSPKPEKRQANSPLPPPPPPPPPSSAISGTHHPAECPAMDRNLDDMYAKVQKSKKKPEKEAPTENHPQPPEKEATIENEHDYETLRKSPRKCSDPGYEKLKPRETEPPESNYDSILSTEEDHNYEMLKHASLVSSETDDPNYERLRRRTSGADENRQPSEDVKSKNSSSYESEATTGTTTTTTRDPSSADEPNYESMPTSESLSDHHHNYAVLKSTGSESDPNYESVKYLDEPPYERLHDDDSTNATVIEDDNNETRPYSTDPGYETIRNKRTNDDDNENKRGGNVQLESDYDGIVLV